ncbi:MAG: ferritin-like domain-containing protein [Actinomycetota bacterium]|nr:ferritin-like domain-containing protein [Actinomycetota bacterium]
MKTNASTLRDRIARLDLSGIDFGAFRSQPVSPAGLRVLRYVHDVEFHTVCYLRDLLMTSAHRDPDITSFLTFWNFEEFWHGEAVARVLNAHGEKSDTERVSAMRARLKVKDRISPLLHGVGSLVAGESWTAVHMTWGAVNEWTTQAAYGRLIAKEEHPVLGDLLHRIMRQEGRHIEFYATEAGRRLETSTRAQRITRYALRKFWKPVGAGVMPEPELSHLTRYLFSSDDGLAVAARVDRQIDRLPGLDGLHLLEGSVQRYAAA